MIVANSSVTALAIATGMLLLNNPNKNHSNVPNVKSEYIDNDIPLVSLVRMVLIACGRNDAVVENAAAKPITVMGSIIYFNSLIKGINTRKLLQNMRTFPFITRSIIVVIDSIYQVK